MIPSTWKFIVSKNFICETFVECNITLQKYKQLLILRYENYHYVIIIPFTIIFIKVYSKTQSNYCSFLIQVHAIEHAKWL